MPTILPNVAAVMAIQKNDDPISRKLDGIAGLISLALLPTILAILAILIGAAGLGHSQISGASIRAVFSTVGEAARCNVIDGAACM
jgi:hypothetical protein